jgi:hypothetical protein
MKVDFRQGIVPYRLGVDPFFFIKIGMRVQLESKVTRINCAL